MHEDNRHNCRNDSFKLSKSVSFIAEFGKWDQDQEMEVQNYQTCVLDWNRRMPFE
jgi:hypothetical protein